MSYDRNVQLSEIIAREMELILLAANDSLINQLQVSQVLPQKGGTHFTILLVPVPEIEKPVDIHKINQHLEHAKGFLRTELAHALNLKKCPIFYFEALLITI